MALSKQYIDYTNQIVYSIVHIYLPKYYTVKLMVVRRDSVAYKLQIV